MFVFLHEIYVLINFVMLVKYIIQYYKRSFFLSKWFTFFIKTKHLKDTVALPVIFQPCFLTNCVSALLAIICTNVPLSLLLTDCST